MYLQYDICADHSRKKRCECKHMENIDLKHEACIQVRTSPMCWAKPVWCLSRGHSILLVKECSSLRRRRKVKVNPCIHQCWHVPLFLLSFIPSFCSSFVHKMVFCSFSRGKDCVDPAEVHVPSMHTHTGVLQRSHWWLLVHAQPTILWEWGRWDQVTRIGFAVHRLCWKIETIYCVIKWSNTYLIIQTQYIQTSDQYLWKIASCPHCVAILKMSKL